MVEGANCGTCPCSIMILFHRRAPNQAFPESVAEDLGLVWPFCHGIPQEREDWALNVKPARLCAVRLSLALDLLVVLPWVLSSSLREGAK